jgi:type II secretory pathway component PulM
MGMSMLAALKPYLNKLEARLAPVKEQLIGRWRQLQPREQQMVAGLGVFLIATTLFMVLTGLVSFKHKLARQVAELNQFTVYSHQAAGVYKQVSAIEANTFNAPDIAQIKADVSQILQIKDPDIFIQDGQMTLNIPNVPFTQVMVLLEQFRRSYAIFPSQINITRQSRSGYVTLSATFWVKQS